MARSRLPKSVSMSGVSMKRTASSMEDGPAASFPCAESRQLSGVQLDHTFTHQKLKEGAQRSELFWRSTYFFFCLNEARRATPNR